MTGIVPTSGKRGGSNMVKISAPSKLTFKDDEADGKQSKYMLDNNAPLINTEQGRRALSDGE